jgi:Tol biopolymer transport system component
VTRAVGIAALAVILAGCTSGQRNSVAGEGKLSESVDNLGFTQLAAVPSVRRVWSGEKVDHEARPSPDGRYLSFTDWNTGDLVVHDLATGKSSNVTHTGGWGSGAFASSSIISPDGNSVAYGWYAEKTGHWELRIAQLKGPDSGKVRTAYFAEDVDQGRAQAWSPDGVEVIVSLSRGRQTNAIAAISSKGGAARILRTVDWRYPQNVVVSPDGRWLAYDFPSDGHERDVYIIGMDGSRDHVVAGYRGDDVVMGWTRSGDRLLIESERGGTPSIWSLTFVDGKTVGEPLLVRSNMWRTIPTGAAEDGRVFYSVITGERDVYITSIDPASAAMSSASISVSGGNQNAMSQAFGWSADGEYVAYVARRGGNLQVSGPEDVIVRSVKRGSAQRFSPRMSRIMKVKWFPDHSVLLIGADDTGKYGIFRMQLSDASLTLLMPFEMGFALPRNPTFSKDGKRFFFMTIDSGAVLINELDFARGAARVIRRIEDAKWPQGLALSPDEKSFAVAVTGKSRLIVAPVGAGPEKVVYKFPPSSSPTVAGIAWTADARNLLFGVSPSASWTVPDDILRLSLHDGKVTSTGLKRSGIKTMSISPDGRTMMYGVDHYSMEMWTMDAPVFQSTSTTTHAQK